MDGKNLLFQLARRLLSGHSSPVTGRLPRDLLPIPFYPVSGMWEPISSNKEDTRLREVPASSELNDWLLLVITGLNLLHGVKPESVFVGPPSKVQTEALSLLAGEVSQFVHQCGGVMEEVDWDHKLQARTVGYDGAEVYTAACLDLERICAALPRLGGLVNTADISTGSVREPLLDPRLVPKENPPGRCSLQRPYDLGLRCRSAKACSGFGKSYLL